MIDRLRKRRRLRSSKSDIAAMWNEKILEGGGGKLKFKKMCAFSTRVRSYISDREAVWNMRRAMWLRSDAWSIRTYFFPRLLTHETFTSYLTYTSHPTTHVSFYLSSM